MCCCPAEVSSVATAAFSFSSLRDINTQRAPSDAIACAEASPIPCVLPPTSAVFPDKSIESMIFVDCVCKNRAFNETH